MDNRHYNSKYYNNIRNVAIQPIGIIRAFYIFYILKIIILECYYKNKRGSRQWRGPVLPHTVGMPASPVACRWPSFWRGEQEGNSSGAPPSRLKARSFEFLPRDGDALRARRVELIERRLREELAESDVGSAEERPHCRPARLR